MFSAFFHTALYQPLYNGLVFLIDVAPAASVGLAVILLTVVVKLILFPLSLKAIKTQIAVRAVEPELKQVREAHKNNKQEQARSIMELYRREGINPFSGFLVLFIQLPIIFALYWVFFRGGLPTVDAELLYAFVPTPEHVNMAFLWISDVSGRSATLALLAGATQYVQISLTLPPLEKRKEAASFKDDLARSFQLQMRYVMPIAVVGIAYFISAAIAIYWTTSNVFAILQEIFVRKRYKKDTV
jgi:YidC/Oxa1 family membrane protein insertase